MTTSHSPPLAINFVWSFADANVVTPVIDAVRKYFSRDRDKPFSRGLNIPIFYFSSHSANELPSRAPNMPAKKNITFIFTSVNTTGRENWKEYIENLPEFTEITSIVPIAIDRSGLTHSRALAGINCIRMYEWPSENRELHAIVSLAHEVYRYGCLSIDPSDTGKSSSITIFLSHAKSGDTGRLHAEEIKKFIDTTNMKRFFDSTEISPGFPFDQEIERNVVGSTLVAIATDAYSSRYWCQREILCAKENNRPIIIVNSLNDYEDRIFPAASNVPCVHVSSDSPMSRGDILRILSSAILETVRHCHSIQSLESYQAANWIEPDCELAARPPEIRQALKVKGNNGGKICYPEPPIYSDEADWHSALGIEAFTPLWKASEKDSLSLQRIGVSISEVQGDGFSSNHIHPDELVRLAQDLARHLLARCATLIYGGDLRPDGFTEFVLDEAAILKERIGGSLPKIENHLAWPLYISDPEIVAWRAQYGQVMNTVQHKVPTDVAEGIPQNVFLPPNTPINRYIWARCLTEMREQSVASSTGRICAGGKTSGYKGKMPGVLEEIVLALELRKPVFLIGAWGGIVGDVCGLLLGGNTPEALTEEWQIHHNEGYADVQKLAKSHGNECNYRSTVDVIRAQKVSELASRCGLSEDEYVGVMRSPFIDECTHKILNGLKNLSLKKP